MIRILKFPILFFLLTVFLGSCKKEVIPPPPTGSNAPVFNATGTFGTETLDFHAGKSNVQMTTQIENHNGVNLYKGILGDGETEVELGIFDSNIDIESTDLPDFTGINHLSYAYKSNQPLLEIKKDSFPNNESILKIQWEVDGVMQPTLNNLSIQEPGRYQVCAHVTFTDNSVEDLCNEIIVGYKSNADFLLKFFLGQNLSFQSWIEPTNGTVQSINWFIDGVSMGASASLNQQLTYQKHLIEAEVRFTNGVKKRRRVLVDGELEGNTIFDFGCIGNPAPIEWDFKSVVKVRKNGLEYSSINTNNGAHKIDVESVTYYGVNANGESVYLLKGNLDVNLKCTTSTTVLPLNMDVTFGFAVK
jgi:hypothetical protein